MLIERIIYVVSPLETSFLKTHSAHVLDMVKRYKADESGATAIEYGLISSLIGVLAITGADALGMSVNDTFHEIGFAIDATEAPADTPRSNATGNG